MSIPKFCSIAVAIAAVTTAQISITAPAAAQRAPSICNPYSFNDRFFGDLSRGMCQLTEQLYRQPRQPAAPANPTSVNYVELGRNIQNVYESSYSQIWDDGARGFIDRQNDIYRITKQISDDGKVVYYARINRNTRILRYNASNDSTGYTDVWSYSVGSGFLKCRVTMMTENGRYLGSPVVTDVETNNMYPAIRTLLAFAI